MNQRDRKLGKVFGGVSKLYASARASYPPELIEDIIRISGISEGENILEIGCGSGIATILFAEKGFKIHAIDISKDLIDIAKESTKDFPNATYEVVSFEDYQAEGSFDLIISAQAWHWVDPEIGYKKAQELLTENGDLALFWKVQDYTKKDFLQKIRGLYIKHCPKYHDPSAVRDCEEQLPKSDLFQGFERKEYHVEVEYSKEKYLGLIQTMSWVVALSEEKRKVFLSEVSGVLAQEKDPIALPLRYTLLIVANKKI